MARSPTYPESQSPQEEGTPSPMNAGRQRSATRMTIAFLVGILGSLFVWIATPYNNFVLNSAYISDSFLPIAALFVMFLIVLVVNPLLRALAPRFALTTRQQALILAVLFIASVVPSQGLLRQLPYCLAKAPYAARLDGDLAEIYKGMNLRPSLFPDNVTGKGTWISDRFIGELLPDESIPWGAWVPPLFAWGLLLLPSWMMMLGLSLIVFPQWRRNERLAFPLLTVEGALIENPGEGRAFAPIFRRTSFWVAAGTVFALHFLSGASTYLPDAVPTVPLNWTLQRLFTEQPLNNVPGYIHTNRVYFIFVAMAFFMPSRIGFSIWFFTLAYAVRQVILKSYFPPYYETTISDHRVGAFIAVMLGILWLGRSHWAHVFGCLFRPPRNDEDRRDRGAGGMFLAGLLGMFLWFTFYARVQWFWSLSFVATAFMISLVITRVVAETGIPFMRIDMAYRTAYRFPFIHMAGPSMVTSTSLYFSYFVSILYALPSRVSATTMAAHGIGLDETASPRHHLRLLWIFLVTLLVGTVISGAAHLWCSYNYSMSLDFKQPTISDFGIRRLDDPHVILKRFTTGGTMDRPVMYNEPAHMLFGAALAGGLQWGCLMSPRFPLHPIGLLMVGTHHSRTAWASIMMGWLLKVFILRYGGARLYRRMQPLLLGLIMGEVFATVFWSLVPPLMVVLDRPYFLIDIQPQ
ncbi:hypothetical protein JW916_00955 [Candidatus Sumerlaeota bacterium]|nr:hypothetical protein [Candidatus Sumerlaeota bacterium]